MATKWKRWGGEVSRARSAMICRYREREPESRMDSENEGVNNARLVEITCTICVKTLRLGTPAPQIESIAPQVQGEADMWRNRSPKVGIVDADGAGPPWIPGVPSALASTAGKDA